MGEWEWRATEGSQLRQCQHQDKPRKTAQVQLACMHTSTTPPQHSEPTGVLHTVVASCISAGKFMLIAASAATTGTAIATTATTAAPPTPTAPATRHAHVHHALC